MDTLTIQRIELLFKSFKEMLMKNMMKLSLVALLSMGLLNAAEAKKELDKETGLIIAPGFEDVKNNCTVCHTATLIIQKGGTKASWKESIVWMQKTQGLWDLVDMEEPVLNYLAANYPPNLFSRRANLKATLLPPNPYDKK